MYFDSSNSTWKIGRTKKVTCDFCGKTTSGGITIAKKHQMGIKGDADRCCKILEDIKLIV